MAYRCLSNSHIFHNILPEAGIIYFMFLETYFMLLEIIYKKGSVLLHVCTVTSIAPLCPTVCHFTFNASHMTYSCLYRLHVKVESQIIVAFDNCIHYQCYWISHFHPIVPISVAHRSYSIHLVLMNNNFLGKIYILLMMYMYQNSTTYMFSASVWLAGQRNA